MDDLLRLARSHLERLSDPAFDAQCDEFTKTLTTALADLTEVQKLHDALFTFRNAASTLKVLCGKISVRCPIDIMTSRVSNGGDMRAEKDVHEEKEITVNVQTFWRYGGEHRCGDDPLLFALLNFRLAAQNLCEGWQNTDGTHVIDTIGTYPFQESFEEVLSKIETWTETTFRRVDGYCVSCCEPDHAQCSLTAGCPCCDMRNSQEGALKYATARATRGNKKKDRGGTQRLKKADSS